MASNAELQKMLAQMQETVAALTAEKDAIAKERDDAKAQAARKSQKRDHLPEILGHSATGIMRSLIALGCTGAEMNKALGKGFEVFASPSGMNTQCSRISKWLEASDKSAKDVKGFGPVALTREEVDTLCTHAGIDKPQTLPEWCKAPVVTATPPAPTTTPPATA